MTLHIDQVEAFGSGGVGSHHRIVHFVYIGANIVLHGRLALAGDLTAFGYGLRIAQTVFTAEIPTVKWVCLANIDDDKLHLLAIFFVEIAQAHDLAHKGRSGKAAKDQRNGLEAAKVREGERCFSLDIRQRKIGRKLALLWRAAFVLLLPSVRVAAILNGQNGLLLEAHSAKRNI
jgi:hypothetical protein